MKKVLRDKKVFFALILSVIFLVAALVVKQFKQKQQIPVVQTNLPTQTNQQMFQPELPTNLPYPYQNINSTQEMSFQNNTEVLQQQTDETKSIVTQKQDIDKEEPQIVRFSPSVVVISYQGKTYTYYRQIQTQVKTYNATKERSKMKDEILEKEQALSIICSGLERRCKLYEGAKMYQEGDIFKGKRIEKIDLDRVIFEDGKELRLY